MKLTESLRWYSFYSMWVYSETLDKESEEYKAIKAELEYVETLTPEDIVRSFNEE